MMEWGFEIGTSPAFAQPRQEDLRHRSNLVLEEDHLILGEHGRILNKIKYDKIESIDLTHERRKSWLIEFLISLLSILISIFFLLKFGFSFFENEYSMSLSTSFAILSAYSLFFLLGIHGLRSAKKRYFISVNNSKVEIEGNELIARWSTLTEFLAKKGISKDRIRYLPQKQ